MITSGTAVSDRAISMLVPAVLRVFRKTNRWRWDAITIAHPSPATGRSGAPEARGAVDGHAQAPVRTASTSAAVKGGRTSPEPSVATQPISGT